MKENDCISRKQTIERLKLNLPISQGADNSRDRHRYMQAMADIQAIREMPSVTAQVDLEGDGYADGELVYDYGKCPKCGWDFEEGDKDWEQPYCCHCGQKLEWFDNEVESER